MHIARSERVSRHTPGKEEVLGGSMRHQPAGGTWLMAFLRSKMGSVPPEVKARMPWRGAQRSWNEASARGPSRAPSSSNPTGWRHGVRCTEGVSFRPLSCVTVAFKMGGQARRDGVWSPRSFLRGEEGSEMCAELNFNNFQ